MRSMTSEDGGDAGGVIQGKELYELEVCFFPLCLALFPRHPGNEKLIVTLAFTGNAEGEGVRSAVSEAGDQLFKRRAPDCPKSKCCNFSYVWRVNKIKFQELVTHFSRLAQIKWILYVLTKWLLYLFFVLFLLNRLWHTFKFKILCIAIGLCSYIVSVHKKYRSVIFDFVDMIIMCSKK